MSIHDRARHVMSGMADEVLLAELLRRRAEAGEPAPVLRVDLDAAIQTCPEGRLVAELERRAAGGDLTADGPVAGALRENEALKREIQQMGREEQDRMKYWSDDIGRLKHENRALEAKVARLSTELEVLQKERDAAVEEALGNRESDEPFAEHVAIPPEPSDADDDTADDAPPAKGRGKKK